VDCEEAFGFAECVVWTQMPQPEESVHYCAPTCAKDEDCSVGASCEVGQVAVVDYENTTINRAAYTWDDTPEVCLVE